MVLIIDGVEAKGSCMVEKLEAVVVVVVGPKGSDMPNELALVVTGAGVGWRGAAKALVVVVVGAVVVGGLSLRGELR